MDNSMIFLNACKNGQKGVVEAFIKKGDLILIKEIVLEILLFSMLV